MAARFNRIPARAICGTVTMPEPNTIALGGVATGIMKAQLAANAAGTAKSSGLCPMQSPSEATTGKNTAAVAVLLVSSVRNTTIAVITLSEPVRLEFRGEVY